MTTPTADIRRLVSAAYTAMMRGRWEVAAERVCKGEYFVHNPWKNTVEASLGTDIADVERYILEHGNVCEPGENVWD